MEEDEVRICDKCGKEMSSGYVINGGEKYFCSDKCLKSRYSKKEYTAMYANGDSDTYWTEW